MKLLFTVEVKDSEDFETVQAYYFQLTKAFEHIVALSAWAFDTPDTHTQLVSP